MRRHKLTFLSSAATARTHLAFVRSLCRNPQLQAPLFKQMATAFRLRRTPYIVTRQSWITPLSGYWCGHTCEYQTPCYHQRSNPDLLPHMPIPSTCSVGSDLSSPTAAASSYALPVFPSLSMASPAHAQLIGASVVQPAHRRAPLSRANTHTANSTPCHAASPGNQRPHTTLLLHDHHSRQIRCHSNHQPHHHAVIARTGTTSRLS